MSTAETPVCREADGGIRIEIPFDGVGTAAFLLCEGKDTVIYDSGSSDEDARTYLLPVIEKMGLRVAAVVASHAHGDHAGGIPALLARFDVPLYTGKGSELCARDRRETKDEETLLLGRYRLIPLMGHSDDGLAIFDEATRTLYTGDAVQLCGVGRYGVYFASVHTYLATLRRVEALAPAVLVPSHAYAPFGKTRFAGGEVKSALSEARRAVMLLAECARTHPTYDDVVLAAAFREQYPALPPAYPAVMREAAALL